MKKWILLGFASIIITALTAVSVFVYSVYNTVQTRSCYTLELVADTQNNFNEDIFVDAFNEKSRMQLSPDGDTFTAVSMAYSTEVTMRNDTITIRSTEALGFDEQKRTFVAQNMGIVIGAAANAGQDVDTIDSLNADIAKVAEEIGIAFDAGQPYSTRLDQWKVEFTAQCQ